MIVEDGNGLIDATSYVSVVYANDYFSARGEKSWAELVDEEKSFALVKSTDFIDNSFDWYGRKLTQNQSLNFPREGLFDNDGYKIEDVPKRLKDAVCECALKISKGIEMYHEENANGLVTSEKIGELAFTYDVSKIVKDKTLYDAINLRLRGLYKDSSKPKIYAMNVRRCV